MEHLSQPRNKNITIRITKKEKQEFNYLAKTNHITESNWAYHILLKHKNSYGKVKDTEQLLEGIKVAIKGLELARELLKSQIKNPTGTYSEKEHEIFMKTHNIFNEIQKLSNLIKQLEQLKE